jgi:hypothetical protein
MVKIHLAILIVHLTLFSVPLHLKPHVLSHGKPTRISLSVPVMGRGTITKVEWCMDPPNAV